MKDSIAKANAKKAARTVRILPDKLPVLPEGDLVVCLHSTQWKYDRSRPITKADIKGYKPST